MMLLDTTANVMSVHMGLSYIYLTNGTIIIEERCRVSVGGGSGSERGGVVSVVVNYGLFDTRIGNVS